MSTSRYTFTPTAYVLPLLHAAKNLSSTCLGVLLGRAPSTGEAETIIEDVIPLIHHYTSLSPMTEAALEMVDVYAKEKGLIVAGVYIAHAGEERELDRVGERILDLLKSSHEGAFGLVVSALVYICIMRLRLLWAFGQMTLGENQQVEGGG